MSVLSRGRLKIWLPPIRAPEGFFKKLSKSLLLSQTRGGIVEEFEQTFSSWLGVESVAVPSARSGLYFILKTLERTETKKEVILAAYNFHVMPTMVRAADFIPVFIDIEPRTYNIDTKQLKQAISEKTTAILVTHMYGLPADMDSILRLADKAGVPVIEDCAHALGATYKGRLVGTFGNAAIFSLSMSKPLPCGGGGMTAMRDPEMLATVREHVRTLPKASALSSMTIAAMAGMMAIGTHPIVYHLSTRRVMQLGHIIRKDIGNALFEERERPEGSQVPHRAILPLQAALGLKQLPMLDIMNQNRTKNAEELSKLLGRDIAPYPPCGRTHVYTHYAIRVKEPGTFRKALWKRGIQTRSSYIKNCSGREFKNTDEAQTSVIYLPVHSKMTRKEIEGLAQAVLEVTN